MRCTLRWFSKQRFECRRERGWVAFGNQERRLAGNRDAGTALRARRDHGDPARRRLDHRTAELGSLRRSDEHVGCLVDRRSVRREADETHAVTQPELFDSLASFAVVVLCETEAFEYPTAERVEIPFAANSPTHDEVRGIHAAIGRDAGGLEDLTESFQRIDKSHESHDELVRVELERFPGFVATLRAEAAKVNCVRDDL